LGIGLAAADCVALLTTEYSLEELLGRAEATTMDAIVSLALKRHGVRRLRRAEGVKVRGRAHLTGEHLLEIGSEGNRIIPRLEALANPDRTFTPDARRAGFGLPQLDELMGGGLPFGSTTTVAGSMR